MRAGVDGVRYSKAVEDVEKEFHHLLRLDRRNRPSINPFGELVNNDKCVSVAPGCLCKGPDQVQSPNREGPCERNLPES